MIKIKVSKLLDAPNGKMNLDLDLNINRGEFVALYGPSGSGKTSTLRMLAGLMRPDQGIIQVDNIKWFSDSEKINLKPQKRNIGFVFQDFALFPNMTVLDNLRFACDSEKKIDQLINKIELGALKNAYPKNLSGGQKQRVALARAVIQQPKILLMDEPLSALDEELRSKLQSYIRQIHSEFGLTTIMISHSKTEITKLADRCISLSSGKIKSLGSPAIFFQTQIKNAKKDLTGKVLNIEHLEHETILTIEIQQQLLFKTISRKESLRYKIGASIIFKLGE